jgi:hypothetical protein
MCTSADTSDKEGERSCTTEQFFVSKTVFPYFSARNVGYINDYMHNARNE